NALNSEMYERLNTAFAESEGNPDIRVRVLLGSEGVFTAGNDIVDFIEANDSGAEVIAPVLEFLRALIFTEKPIVAAIDGLAIGVGTTMLFHCDLIYATHESVFVTPFIDLGLVPEAGSSLIAPQRMGYAAAFAMLVAGKPLTAEGAVRSHLINAIVPRANLEAHAMERATKLATKPQHAMAMSRKLLRGDPYFIWQRVQEEARLFKECLGSPEARAAFEAFTQRTSQGQAQQVSGHDNPGEHTT
ncbi:MAG: enoyl-CoA hydratase-related protein, partial [Alphaproteobacteria bacterium]